MKITDEMIEDGAIALSKQFDNSLSITPGSSWAWVDNDGTTDKNRQAFRDDVRAVLVAALSQAERMCVNCGRTRLASEGRETPHKDCPAPEACTWDLTPDEAWEFWCQKYHDVRDSKIKADKFIAELKEKLHWSINQTEKAICVAGENRDRIQELQIKLDDLQAKLNKTMKKMKQSPCCASCHGHGVVARGYGFTSCEACNGKGF